MDIEKTWECMEAAWKAEADAVAALGGAVDKEALLAVTELIFNCKGKIIFSGCGTSGVAARKAVHTLNCVGASSTFISPSDALHGGLGILRSGDVLVLLSKGGQSSEINAFIEPCKKSGATLVAVTEHRNSDLGAAADHLLILVTEQETKPWPLATTSILKVIAVFDAIAQAIALHKNQDQREFYHIHPGGAVGKALSPDSNPRI